MTVGEDITVIQSRLHDPDGILWSRNELLNWYNDGYARMLGESRAVKRWVCHDLPPRWQQTCTYEWEQEYASPQAHTWAFQADGYATSTLWEAEVLSGLASTASKAGFTQLWEMSYAGVGDGHYRIALDPKSEGVERVEYDNERLAGVHVRELDVMDTAWHQDGTYPLYWLGGLGRHESIEIYEITTTYIQAYHHTIGAGNTSGRTRGVPRRLSGDRTYAQAKQAQETVHGLPRRIMSADRQYVPTTFAHGGIQRTGTARRFTSSDDNIAILQTIGSNRSLTFDSFPDLIPSQLRKYMRFYVLSKAFSKNGEGQRWPVATLYRDRYDRGVALFAQLKTLTTRDRTYRREESQSRSTRRPAQIRLPSNYPRSR